MNIKSIIRQCAWLLLLPLLTGCGAAAVTQVAQTDTPVIATKTVTIVTPTLLPTETTSPTPSLEATATQIVRPTPLPVAKLSLDVAKKKFDILEQSADCQLPCFNGLTPGISSDWEAQDFFASLGFDKESIPRDFQGRWRISTGEVEIQYFEIPYLISSNLSDRPNLLVTWQNGKITSIGMGFLPYRKWISIPRFLLVIDETPQIILSHSFGGEMSIPHRSFLIFLFPKKQLQLTYLIPDLNGPVKNGPVCMSADIPVDVYITLGHDERIYNLCYACDPTIGYDWSKQLNMKPEDLIAAIGDGDFCLSPAYPK